MIRNIAVVLAGGIGSRLGLSTPKQFYKVAGRMVIEYTVDTFEHNAHINEIAIVGNPHYVTDIKDIVQRNGWQKVKKVLKGGSERYNSTLAAIRAYDNEEVNLIFHDAVRPLISARIINDVCKALLTHEAIEVAIPSADTIIEVEDGHIYSIPDRSRLWRSQTPQAFRRSLIARAYECALRDPTFCVTDDCSVIVKYAPQTPIYIVRGDESNMKLTYKDDLDLLCFLLERKAQNENRSSI